MFKATRVGLSKNRRSQRGSSEISEFIPAVYILFLITFLPLINLGVVFVAAATQYLATNDFVSKASTQVDYPSALNTMAGEAYRFQSTGLSNFVCMLPNGGYTGCGDDLYVVTTNIASGAVTSSPANMPITSTPDTGANIYELSVKSTYTVSPLINLSAVPILGDVPGLGKPATLTFVANRPVEHPGGLQASPTGGGGTTGTVTPFNRITNASPTAAVATLATWRTPNIFQQIQAAGESVVTVNVITVPANFGPTVGAVNGGWVPTGITVQPGQEVWIDTQAVGQWDWPGSGFNPVDANGATASETASWAGELMNADLPLLMLMGYVGNAPILPYGHFSGAISGDPHFIPSGDTLLNYPITFTGPISLAANDNQLNDTGSQEVRIIITQ